MRLTVHQMAVSDIFSDRVRLNYSYREGIKSGSICRLRVNNASALVEVRNTNEKGGIWLDDDTRGRLSVRDGLEYEFEQLELVGFLGEMIWFARAANPVNRVAGKMGLLSLVLGVISLVVAIIPFLGWICGH